MFFVSTSAPIEFEDKPAGILGVNKVVIRFPTRFDPTLDVWEEIVDFHVSSTSRSGWTRMVSRNLSQNNYREKVQTDLGNE